MDCRRSRDSKHTGATVYEQIAQMKNEFVQRQELVRTGSLVPVIMFQVILLALMGSNNAAREIAGERLIFEKEKIRGVRPSAYVASKAAFLGVLVFAQSVMDGGFREFDRPVPRKPHVTNRVAAPGQWSHDAVASRSPAS